jgi:hypothetical protein
MFRNDLEILCKRLENGRKCEEMRENDDSLHFNDLKEDVSLHFLIFSRIFM